VLGRECLRDDRAAREAGADEDLAEWPSALPLVGKGLFELLGRDQAAREQQLAEWRPGRASELVRISTHCGNSSARRRDGRSPKRVAEAQPQPPVAAVTPSKSRARRPRRG